MQRIITIPRNRWQERVENLGFGFHTAALPYWDESACYSFRAEEITLIEKATAELWEMCLEAVQYVIDEKRYDLFCIPPSFAEYLEQSWNGDHPSIYGRFDLCYREGAVKLLEFNADTPTSLFEAGIVQWFWLQDFDPGKDQFNSIHEKLIESWRLLQPWLHPGKLHFSCIKDSLEDLTNTEYLRDCAVQAGIDTPLVYMEEIGWDLKARHFVGREGERIRNLFKLYPWEWMLDEPFGKMLLKEDDPAFLIEPAWKMILSNKAILPVLWQLFPDNPWLLPAFFEENRLVDFVRKPLLSREGSNVGLVAAGRTLCETTGEYGEEGFVYQQLFTLPEFQGNYPVIGSWVIGQQPAGIGIREADTLITGNTSRFVPHFID